MSGPSVRIHLTIPRELRERMKATPGISWSQVAARAFHQAIKLEAELKRRDGAKDAGAPGPGGARNGAP